MLNPIVLRHVSQPGKLVMACPKATTLSFCLSGIVCVLLQNVLLALWTFLPLQTLMIFLTYKDPYFMNLLFAFLKCKKTKNYYPIRGNRYEP